MLNYLKKFALEILPSVAATVIGAYIVNHYISKPAPNAPVAAVTAPADARKAKPADGADVANAPQPGVKAKGISERGMIEKAASEQPGEFKPSETKPAPDTKSADTKPVESKPAETASAPAEPRRHFWSAPKTASKSAPAPATSPAAPAETAATTASAPADGRDANDLARAAIERLRGSDSQPKTQEAARTPDVPRVEAPRTIMPAPTTASVKPLPPPITVAPPVETAAVPPPYTASVDPNRPVPPADIPPPPPIDIRADASKLATRTTNMAQDVLRSAKSMFHAVIPNSDRQSSSSASQFTD